jgi:hypothetical protein
LESPFAPPAFSTSSEIFFASPKPAKAQGIRKDSDLFPPRMLGGGFASHVPV